MHINEFKKIAETFADPGTELLFDKTRIVMQVNDELIEATISTRSGDIYVNEGNGEETASKWVVNRLARLSILAMRLGSGITATEHFVTPSATLLPTLEQGPDESPISTTDALSTTLAALKERSPLETMVFYITSDAGEGKTSLINELARLQAKQFSDNKSDWLIVPIPLGGRNFLRFDDITIGALQNRYRFPFLYYNSFLALIKMGVIVPAFDGFEEMFVENSSGEALSAMGILVGSLESQGALIVAARKAYFEFENLRSQERLFDTIRDFSVGFGKLELQRWGKSQFISYCKNRRIDDSEELYIKVCERLGENHALLTRAVLVKRLIDVAEKSSSLDVVLEKVQKSGADFFSVFVRSLIEREAGEKWIDRSGDKDVGSPLLTVEEHCVLLSQIALGMWESKVDFLKRENLEFIADYFSEENHKNNYESQQIRKRISAHAMLVPSPNADNAVEFDHDEFRHFFLGEGIAAQILAMEKREKAEVFASFRRGVLPMQVQHALVRALSRDAPDRCFDIVNVLIEVSGMDTQASYTQENCGNIIVKVLNGVQGGGLVIKGLTFGIDILRDMKISGVSFQDCYFLPTSLELTELSDCTYQGCNFAQLRAFNSTSINNVCFDDTTVEALSQPDREKNAWNPDDIRQQLIHLGVNFPDEVVATGEQAVENKSDVELRDMEKIIRYFMRSTHISESVMRIKLGPRGAGFIDNTLPVLLKHGVMEEIENRGGGDQRRFRLNASLQIINESIVTANGSFESFLNCFPNKH